MSEANPERTIKSGIVIDDWKLPTFSRMLTEEGYGFEKAEGPVKGTLTLVVMISDVDSFAQFTKRMNLEAQKSKLN